MSLVIVFFFVKKWKEFVWKVRFDMGLYELVVISSQMVFFVEKFSGFCYVGCKMV